jgi:hypothetical protein
MKSMLTLALAAAIVAPLALTPQISQAASHPRVEAQDCGTLAVKIGPANVWQASFTGMRHPIGHFRFFERTSAIGCFRTQAACVNWLYWEQSDWPYMNSAGRCRKGMPYGR